MISLLVSRMVEQTSVRHNHLLKHLTEPLFKHFGIHYFCYQFVTNDGQWFTLGNHPEWLLFSANQQFYQVDPSLIHPKHYPYPSVCLPQHHQHVAFQNTLMAKAINDFDINHAIAIIEPTSQGCEYYFLGAPTDNVQVLNTYLTQLSKLRYDFIRYFKENIQQILPQCFDSSINLNQLNPETFHASDNVLQLRDETHQELGFLMEIQQTSPLTPREYQCLRLYQQGLTAKQTARHLKLSYRTIEEYFENIKIKYGVRYKHDLLGVPRENV